MTKAKLLFIGNCQKNLMAKMAELLAFDVEVQIIHSGHIRSFGARKFLIELHESDIVFTQPLIGDAFGEFEEGALESIGKPLLKFPSLTFTGYHPDTVYLDSGKQSSPIGDYHSAIAALAHHFKYDSDTALKLYCGDIYSGLGYYDMFDSEVSRLAMSLNKFGIDLGVNIPDLMRSGRMMHTVNHPTATFLSIFTKALLKLAGIKTRNIDPAQYIVDNFPDSTVFPMFPEIASQIGIAGGSYLFKADLKTAKQGCLAYDLADFVDESLSIYGSFSRKSLLNPRFTSTYIDKAREVFEATINGAAGSSAPRGTHPYQGLPSYQFWLKSFPQKELQDVDIAVDNVPFIGLEDKIATAGSCFAQHIAKSLSASGYNYFIAEKPANKMSEVDAIANGYGVFSARYGNVYTARQLLQLFDRAFSSFAPDVPTWYSKDGRVVDPFRPQAEPKGFSDLEAMLTDRKSHLSAVRRMFEELDIFIFTLGLTEAWCHKLHGAILPIAPGTAAGGVYNDEYEAVNFSYDDVKSDMIEFLDKLKKINPRAQVLLTVSPVPLAATFENRHVLVSTTVSKSILRTVADELSRSNDYVQYFPSYEIITGNYTRSEYYADDLREVRPKGVAHVMKTFLQHCVHVQKDFNHSIEADSLAQIICDEELLNP